MIEISIFFIILIGTYLTSFYNYLLFHSIAELFSIIIAGGIFVIAWNSRKYMDNSFFTILGISFLFIGFIDIIHTLAYKGMNIFIGYDANLPTQLWISARYLQAFSYLIAFYGFKKKIDTIKILLGYTLITLFLILSIFIELFPDCYVEGVGLTPFKVISEYIIISILFSVVVLIYRFRFMFDPNIFKLIIGSIIIAMFSELSFTAYISVYDIFNLVGHLLKIASFFLLYLAIINIGLENPFNLLFQKSKMSEEKYQYIIDESLEGVWIIDSRANTTFVNDSMAKMLGYTMDEMIGKSLFTFMDDDNIKIAQQKFNVRKQGRSEIHDFEFLRKDGNKVYTLLKTTPIINEKGTFDGAFAFVSNLTDRKKAEENLKRFVSTVSHELRTPITVLMMSIEYLNKNKHPIENEVQQKLLDAISRNIKNLKELIDDLLILSKVDEKKMILTMKRYSPLEIINEILFLIEPTIKEKNLIVEMEISDEIKLMGDEKRINQVFRILLDNAVKFSKNNSKIEIKAIEQYKGKYNPNNLEGILFQFIDKGMGIPAKDLPHIFERFFRSETVSDIPGTGLGLSIAKEFVLFHEGQIFVESKYNQGSTFFVFLPQLNFSKA